MCSLCQKEYEDYAAEQNALSELLARDPANDPTHREATDAEWWDWVTGA